MGEWEYEQAEGSFCPAHFETEKTRSRGQCNSGECLHKTVGKKKYIFLYRSRILADIPPAMKEKLTEKKKLNLCVLGSQRYETQRSDQSGQLSYFLDKETIPLWRVDRTNKYGFGGRI